MVPFVPPACACRLQGVLRMWVDILTPDQAKRFAPVPIARPPPEPFELRVILWRADKVKAMDEV